MVIQPRRLAVYGAAHRMSELLEETIGQTIAYTTRYDRKGSPQSQIEVITEGIFLRMIQQDPELSGISTVIFDEFHERSVANDLSLAFALEAQQDLRDEATPLKLVVMSATLDGEALANWLQAPLIQSQGRAFPVATEYHSLHTGDQLATHIVKLICKAIAQHSGSLLVFLPGMGEINRVYQQLNTKDLPQQYQLYRLHSALPQVQQRAAINPPTPGLSKIVLTTNVAETSITIEGISIVIDSGLQRVSRYDERKGMNVLVTEKISLAAAEQRRGRAGRLSAGHCYRAWSESDHKSRRAFGDPEISHTDLLPVALELAIWGCNDGADLQLLTAPEAGALQRAQSTLVDMGAIRKNGTITTQGRHLAELGIHPRLAQLILTCQNNAQGSAACATAAILSEGDPLRTQDRFPPVDLTYRLALWQSNTAATHHKGTWERIKKLAKQLMNKKQWAWQPEALMDPQLAVPLARAFPDHIAQRRENPSASDEHHRYVLANGKGVKLHAQDQLIGTDYLVVLDASGQHKEPWIRLAFALEKQQLETAVGEQITTINRVIWHKQKQAAESHRETRFHQLVLHKTVCPPEHPDALTACLFAAIQDQGVACLPWQTQDRHLQHRLQWLHQKRPNDWPDFSDATLQATLKKWLYPHLAGLTKLSETKQLDLSTILLSTLDWDKQKQLTQLAPASWLLPTGQTRAIDYNAEHGPTLRARMQELYVMKNHPNLLGTLPITVEILSPANRPIQITQDLPGFWQGSYEAVAKEMRGRYPKHLWPVDPASTEATTKTRKQQK
jgi:ATP-dependent helicase HrpB